MEDREIQLVQDSFAKVRPIASMAAEIFYAQLFTIAPEVELLFKWNKQRVPNIRDDLPQVLKEV